MKTMLLILLTLATLAYAQAPMTDAEMKALIVGTWKLECAQNTTWTTFWEDGRWDDKKWDVQDGMLVEIPKDPADRKFYFKILLLTEDEFLALGVTVHNKGYFLYTHHDENY
jgi:hypothetical protein